MFHPAIALAFTFILLPIVVLLWIYSDAPDVLFDPESTDRPHHHNKRVHSYELSSADFPIDHSLRNPVTIHLPFLRSTGYINLKPIPEEAWIEVDEDVAHQLFLCHRTRSRLCNRSNCSQNVFLLLPRYRQEVELAGYEALDLVVAFLNRFHPGMVSCSKLYAGGDSAIVDTYIVRNHVTMFTFDVSPRHKEAWELNRMLGCDVMDGHETAITVRAHPLLVARLLIGDDLALMLNVNGTHILVAGVVFFPDDWRLEDKLGLSLAAIHYPVAALNSTGETEASHTNPSSSAYLRTMERFFDRMHDEGGGNSNSSNSIHNRFNWAFQTHPYMSNRFEGWAAVIKETVSRVVVRIIAAAAVAASKSTGVQELPLRIYLRETFTSVANFIRVYLLNLPLLELYFRTENQTLRLLPRSRMVLFTIRTRVTPVSEAIVTVEQARGLREALLSPVYRNDNRARREYRDELLSWLGRKYGAMDG